MISIGFRPSRDGFAKNIGTDFIDLLVAAEVPARKDVVLTDIFDFTIFVPSGKLWRSCRASGGSRRNETASEEVSGGQGKSRAP